MNIIFEGISGAGKTTIINGVCESLKDEGIPYERIGDLEYDTPLKQLLLNIVSESPLMSTKERFNTSLYESLLLAANHHYTQEKLRDCTKVCLYDRDFLSLLAYQYILLKDEYDNYEEIYDVYKKLVLLNLKEIDSIFYVDAPIDTCIKRTEKRDNRRFSQKEIKQLLRIEDRFNTEMLNYPGKIIRLDGEQEVQKNVETVLSRIRKR